MANIVVIDDDSALCDVMRRILEREGHDVRTAENGVAGMQLIAESAPDLVITDLLMPEKEGIETIMEIGELFPGVRIIAISGAGTMEDEAGPLADAELLGATATLSKPFSVEQLLALVDRTLGSD